MQVVRTTMTIADYSIAMERKEITVNRTYQRSERIWPLAARSFLIETILLGYPIPKLSLYQVTDVRTRKTQKEIVDGQQRSQTIFDFLHDHFSLASRLSLETARGRTYSELDEDLKQQLLDYPLQLDLLVGATPEDVREMFRRINSYTVPLNYEEQRHALYQGPFKWFIYGLSKRFDRALIDFGILPEKGVIRMADCKLFSEVCHALLQGISTTSKIHLDRLYNSRDREFPEEVALRTRIESAMTCLGTLEEFHRGSLMRPYLVYSLLLAYSHIMEPVDVLRLSLGDQEEHALAPADVTKANLSRLAAALDDPDNAGHLLPFVEACQSKTNVSSQRTTRFRWIYRALAGLVD